ncbi:MAG: hypothetical protein FWD51_00350 [Betaproteobacteria bacterium]|nr:hypothetical protein [Betaproteobacteria bacterium]
MKYLSNNSVKTESRRKETVSHATVQKFLCIVTMCALCIPVAFSSDIDGKGRAAGVATEKEIMPREDAEAMAQRVFKEDINAGNFTLQKAGEYYKCAQEDYSNSLMISQEGKRVKNNLQRMQNYSKLSAKDKARHLKEIEKSTKEMERLQNRAESRCMKKLDMNVTRGKVFGRAPTEKNHH